jgi:iron complex outermembrane receptor protein
MKFGHVIACVILIASAPARPADGVQAADGPQGTDARQIEVIGTRSTSTADQLPVASDVVGRDRLSDGELGVNLSEALGEVAGVNAEQRQNYAQDLQVSIRGFGARSSFGVRGLRLYADGIPATMPDGQGQFSHFDMAGAGRLEILRGPYSVLYGNAAGGVIALYTREPPTGNDVDAMAAEGPWDTQRYDIALSHGGSTGSVLVDAGRFQTDGYRDHSAARRDLANARVHWEPTAGSEWTLIGNVLDQPLGLDPLGLTRAQLRADPTQAGTNALLYDTRKTVQQQQLGLHHREQLTQSTELEVMTYAGSRTTRQYQAIPKAAEAAVPTNPGGVIDLARQYRGIDARIAHKQPLAAGQLQWTAGVAADGLDEARRGYLNYSGSTLGVLGGLRRAEANRVYDLDEYGEAQYDTDHWLLLAGVRHSAVDVRSRNELKPGSAASEPDYAATDPVAGVTLKLPAQWRVWGAYGQGFETPTLNDLAYRSIDGSVSGLNLALRPARSRHYELGVRDSSDSADGVAVLHDSLSVFQIDTVNELAALVSAGGRTVYHNVASTRRRGVELESQADWGRWSALLSMTLLDARSYTGARLPAVPEDAFGAGLTGHWAPLAVTLEAQVRSRIFVDDRNTDAAAGYAVLNLHAELAQRPGSWHLTESLRVDNLLDRHYVGSIIVNEANGGFFEPEPGRAVWLMLRVQR